MFEVYVDGGCIVGKNIGAAAAVFVGKEGMMKTRCLSAVGDGTHELTNNIAEYTALLLAMKEVIESLNPDRTGEITFYSDSELVIKQINGEYKTNDEELRTLKSHVNFMISMGERDGHKFVFKNVPRENKYIMIADKMNKVMMEERK